MRGSIIVVLPQGVNLFVPQTTLVRPKDGIVPATTRDSFASPSLVSAGGVMAAFVEGHMDAEYQGGQLSKAFSSDVVAGYIDSAWNWSTLVGEVKKDTWRAHTVLGAAEGEEGLGVVLRPTTTTKGNEVFLHAGSSDVSYEGGCWREGGLELKLVVGDAANPTGGRQSGRIEWGDSKPLSKLISSASHEVDGRSSLLLVAQVL
ncbi:trans-sialidase, putative [Trypanosoma cruzi marinkellei]|uniref:Trans-sialidase, putative n=1 Tax=Trypanosoma cruzi marinkellei TaxID=85056 RepID=K2NM38_TRYCR|nr:trans-sialidase, putative [Trypanosoma cruzi marinkellei]